MLNNEDSHGERSRRGRVEISRKGMYEKRRNHIEKPENRKLGKNEDCCEGLMKST